jgi:digeranylgeranylglycerophospholipid reductase
MAVEPDVLVVGAGPSGSCAAAILSRDFDVTLIEEHAGPGSPLQCAGLVTSRGVPEYAQDSIVSMIRGAHIHSPLGYTLSLESKGTQGYVVDRPRLDSLLFERAVDSGAVPLLRTRVSSLSAMDECVRVTAGCDGSPRVMTPRVVVGADGHNSTCRRATDLSPPRHVVKGMQVDLEGVEMDPEFVEVFLGHKVAPGFFGWAVPAGDVVRLGLCVWGDVGTPSTYLKKLMSMPRFARGRKVSTASGRIPLGVGRSATSGPIVLVGDAACHAKPLSGGGVFTGIRGAELAAEAVRAHLSDPETCSLKAYDELWREEFGRELAKAFRLRRIFLGLTDKKMDKALRMFGDPSVKSLIEARGDIDYPSSLSSPVLKLAPKLVQFSPELIKSLL